MCLNYIVTRLFISYFISLEIDRDPITDKQRKKQYLLIASNLGVVEFKREVTRLLYSAHFFLDYDVQKSYLLANKQLPDGLLRGY